jgi:hypothetical protein
MSVATKWKGAIGYTFLILIGTILLWFMLGYALVILIGMTPFGSFVIGRDSIWIFAIGVAILGFIVMTTILSYSLGRMTNPRMVNG